MVENCQYTIGAEPGTIETVFRTIISVNDEWMEDRTGRPVVFAQHTDRFIVENDKMNSYTEAESEMSLESRSILHRVNDQVKCERGTTQSGISVKQTWSSV